MSPPPLLLIHGAGMDHRVWAGLDVGPPPLTPDLPGHGVNPGPALPTIEAMADWLAGWLDQRAITQVAAAGHSLGALVALALAAHHPARVARLTLIGAAPQMPVHPDLLAAAADDLPQAATMIARWGLAAGNRDQPITAGGASLFDWTRTLVAASAPGVLQSDLAACAACTQAPDWAARVRVPCRVVTGGADKMTPPAAGAALAAAIAGATLVEIADCGHMIMLEAPQALAAALAG